MADLESYFLLGGKRRFVGKDDFSVKTSKSSRRWILSSLYSLISKTAVQNPQSRANFFIDKWFLFLNSDFSFLSDDCFMDDPRRFGRRTASYNPITLVTFDGKTSCQLWKFMQRTYFKKSIFPRETGRLRSNFSNTVRNFFSEEIRMESKLWTGTAGSSQQKFYLLKDTLKITAQQNSNKQRY